MSILDKKRKVFGKIAAARTLTETMPQLKLTSSLPSINNNGDVITFLTDLIKSLIGYQELVKIVTDILTYSTNEIELRVKKALKIDLKSIVSCGIDPKLPTYLTTGDGIVVEVKKIDFFDIFKVDPTSTAGKLIYGDPSTDFNAFLYYTIQDGPQTRTWKGILDFKFMATDPNNINPNNCLIIKANPNFYSKTLNDLNNNYIDSIDLFNTEELVNKIVDMIFGSISININKTTKQLENEAKVNAIVDSIVNSDCDTILDDSYFTFTNDEISTIEQESTDRKRGIIKYKTSIDFNASIPQQKLNDFSDEMGTAVTIQDKRSVLSKNLDEMAELTTDKSNNPEDKQSVKLNFIQLVINYLIKAIVNSVLSPKIVIIFLINFKIVYGKDADFKDGVDFIKKNKTLIQNIIKNISELIITKLTKIALKKITELGLDMQAKIMVDKAKAKTAQLLSLVGIPQEVLRIIKNI